MSLRWINGKLISETDSKLSLKSTLCTFTSWPRRLHLLPEVGVQPGEHGLLDGLWRLQEDGACEAGGQSQEDLPAACGGRRSQRGILSTLESDQNTQHKAVQRAPASPSIHLQVNLDAATREETRQNVENAGPCCFDEAQKVIYTLMEKDSYRRFLNSKLMHKLSQSFHQQNIEKRKCNWPENSRLLAGGA